jgi:hypothetical protein
MKVLVTMPKGDLSHPMQRRYIANLASNIVEVSSDGLPNAMHRLPYMPNEGDTLFWTVDSHNDWKIKFKEGDQKTFEVIHRYQINDPSRANEHNSVNEAVKSLAGWLAYRLSGTVYVDMELELASA